MRLLHSQTLQFKVFNGERLPSFLILSHTWGDEEVNYQDMVFVQQLESLPEDLRNKPEILVALGAAIGLPLRSREDIIGSAGFRKIQKTAEVAREHHYEYFWVDTCCIDKTNSAELQEAINSMFLWYQKSAVCVVYLEDVAAGLNWMDNDLGELLPKSRWTTRGWTLQELIAPRNVHFYDQSWVYITQKHAAPFDVHRATKIPEYVLLTGDLSRASVAQKMSWAAYRSTVRIEDRAYSLMGLFGVHVPMLYGEGENAFIRLQEEILRTTADDSIFAWHAEEVGPSVYRGLLARSPNEFKGCSGTYSGQPLFASSSHLGIRLDLEVSSIRSLDGRDKLLTGWLRSGTTTGPCNIILRGLSKDTYGTHCARVMAIPAWRIDSAEKRIETIYIRQKPELPPSFSSEHMYCFHFRRSGSDDVYSSYSIVNAWPRHNWLAATKQLLIDEEDPYFLGVIWLDPVREQHLPFGGTSLAPFQVLLGYDRSAARVWCKIVASQYEWPSFSHPSDFWKSTIKQRYGPFDSNRSADVYQVHDRTAYAQGLEITASIGTGLYQDRISFIVDLDGLVDNL